MSNSRAGTIAVRRRVLLSPQIGGRVSELPQRGGDRCMRVIGVIADHGQQVGLDTGLMGLVPVASAMSMYNEPGLFRILVQVGAFQGTQQACERISEVLLARHGEADFTGVTQDSVSDSLGSILRVLTLPLTGIASFSLAALVLSLLTGLLSGALPARRAARMDPIDALKAE